MKTIIFALTFLLIGCSNIKVKAQSNEVIQLLLNVEKLAQFKQILSDMKKGYQVLSAGYNTVKDLSKGNFNMHKLFMDGLMEASPTVKKYHKVARIIEYQIALAREYKKAYNRFKSSNLLQPAELNYMANVYTNLINQSLQNIDALANVITSGKLQMTDDERLSAIDTICADMEDKLNFLRSFNSKASILTLQREKELNELKRIKTIYNLKN